MIKICKSCKRELSKNTDYFFKKKDTKDGFTNKCKECMGRSFTKKLQSKMGFKFCVACNRELKIHARFFPPDKSCSDGFRNKCRICTGESKEYLPKNYKSKKQWSKEEEIVFIERYPHYTNEELKKIHYPNLSIKQLANKAFNLNVKKSEETRIRINQIVGEKNSENINLLTGVKFSEERRKKHAKIFKEKYSGENSYWYGKKRSREEKKHLSKVRRELGLWKGSNNPRYKNPLQGEENGRWKGGITPKSEKIRNSKEYIQWRDSVYEKDDYTCQYCGDSKGGNLEAHHIENFSENEKQRFVLSNGITLCKKHHNPIFKGSFHDVYKTRGNNLGQLEEYFTGASWSINNKSLFFDRTMEVVVPYE